jgi:type IV pilus assembly protein PilE
MKNHSGFTLMEVLVVVLIIGILSSIALPQYQKAVMRSRFAQMVIYNNAIVKAQQAYYATFMTYATEMDQLDITLPVIPSVSCNVNYQGGTLCHLYNGSQRNIAIIEQSFTTNSFVCCTYAESNYVGDSLCQAEMNNKSWYNGCGSTPCHCYRKQ